MGASYLRGTEKRHALTNRIESKGIYWKNDNGVEILYFFPSVVWSSFVDLSDPLGGITITAPSDYIKINDSLYIIRLYSADIGVSILGCCKAGVEVI